MLALSRCAEMAKKVVDSQFHLFKDADGAFQVAEFAGEYLRAMVHVLGLYKMIFAFGNQGWDSFLLGQMDRCHWTNTMESTFGAWPWADGTAPIPYSSEWLSLNSNSILLKLQGMQMYVMVTEGRTPALNPSAYPQLDQQPAQSQSIQPVIPRQPTPPNMEGGTVRATAVPRGPSPPIPGYDPVQSEPPRRRASPGPSRPASPSRWVEVRRLGNGGKRGRPARQ
ncbi:hypothetical protein VTL71DRAFT_5624 [Oculimacula yallundae]|uniref:Uncharacterized protein n=1 Tax=Oculimacula yallundae TaxID=86028 RepID=A0ABR4C1N0_9HELO